MDGWMDRQMDEWIFNRTLLYTQRSDAETSSMQGDT